MPALSSVNASAQGCSQGAYWGPKSTTRKILRENVQKNNAIFVQFVFINFLANFCHFCPQFFSGSNCSSQKSPINFNSTRTSDSGKTGSS